uniref:complement decay-accelerating factor n=1 Tax=Euleptes europaea TaxID=460621 RepID=UPI00254063DC|nr:complement decay-accelerating factor [Euleptes europaea]
MPASLLSRAEPELLVLFALLAGIRGDCGIPPKLNNVVPQRYLQTERFPTDTVVAYICLHGFYNVHGKTDVTTCLSNSQWSPIEDFCKSSCPEPFIFRYAHPKPEDSGNTYYPPGTNVTYVCSRGYDSIPGMSPVIITCFQNNTWSEVPVFCKGKSCGDPGKPQNGRAVIITDLLYRSKVNFTCDDGYRLIGSPFTKCLMKNNTVKWNKETPDCQPITCSSPPYITDGTHDGGASTENFPYNSTVTYKCKNGFSLIGEASIHCTTEDKVRGIWHGPAPECKAMTTLTALSPSTSLEVEKRISSAEELFQSKLAQRALDSAGPNKHPIKRRVRLGSRPAFRATWRFANPVFCQKQASAPPTIATRRRVRLEAS